MGNMIFLAGSLLLGGVTSLGTDVLADETPIPHHMEGIETPVNMNDPDAAVTSSLLSNRIDPAVNSSVVSQKKTTTSAP